MPSEPRLRATRTATLLLALALASTTAAGPGAAADETWGPMVLLDAEVEPGSVRRLSFLAEPSFLKESLDMHVLAARGARPGPTLCLTAGVHGDEINGVEVARRTFDEIDPAELSGTLLAIPMMNVWGFRSGNRYLPDRRDLNRAFPGTRSGSTASRIAFAVFEQVIRRCDALVDLHTGSAKRTNLPQIRADVADERAAALATHFDVGIVMVGAGPKGSLRRAAMDAGIPAIIYEAGGPGRFEHHEIVRGLEGVRNVMEQLDMLETEPPPEDPQKVFHHSSWVRATGGGIFLSDLELGRKLRKGEVLGRVIDPVTNERVEVVAPFAGTLIGMAFPQVVLPGFALFHVGHYEPPGGAPGAGPQ